jgi:hypothetical protein
MLGFGDQRPTGDVCADLGGSGADARSVSS